MEKLKKYNQVLLATIGTLTLLFGFLCLIYVAFEVWSRARYDTPEPQIMAEEEAKKLAADSIRRQVISFNRAELIDSAQLFYLIPVGQAQLNEDELLGLTNRYESHYGDSKSYIVPTYNNILFYNAAAKITYPLFKKRVSVNDYGTYYLSNQVIAYFSVSDVDSNRDGFMSDGDLQKLYIFLPESQRLIEIESGAKTYYSLHRLGETNDFVAKYGLDRNKNGQFDSATEPYVFYRLNIQEGNLTDIIPDTLIEQLQRRLDGQEN